MKETTSRIPPLQDPVVSPKDSSGQSRETHPAYGMIGASRVSGQAALFGSDFLHQHYVTITIRKADLGRNLSNDWPFAYEEIVEVALSEAQWASFVSTMNVGQGVQCTLQHLGGEYVPQLKNPTDRQGQFKNEMKEHLEELVSDLAELKKSVEESTLGVKAKQVIQRRIEKMERDLGPNLKFTADQFTEHIESVTEHAKIEVNAYVESVIHRTGLEALKVGSPIALPKKVS